MEHIKARNTLLSTGNYINSDLLAAETVGDHLYRAIATPSVAGLSTTAPPHIRPKTTHLYTPCPTTATIPTTHPQQTDVGYHGVYLTRNLRHLANSGDSSRC